MIVLLKENWEPVGQASKLASHHHDTPLHLAFSCYAFDLQGRFLLTRRARTKKTWPGIWTNSCCGHPAPGEPLHEAVGRRLRAELGVQAERLDVVLDAVRYRAVMDNGIVENEVGPVVRVLLTAPLQPNPGEVDAIRWTSWPDLVAAATEGAAEISPWSLITIRKLAGLGPDPWKWPAIPRHELPGGLQ
ncbi:isopentenyl-diphosphate Delta-isomerase [Streptomyces sp. NPDC051555]|uniref:isopentenyl-diphosphate Delta-isomerase n=1 Tax=Streptomyces sp. NPDC051555 TaxID=3365657 RepID=UPI00379905C1